MERSFKRRNPHKSSRLVVIIAEGKNKEPNYFKQFEFRDSRIKLQIISPDITNKNNSAKGLLKQAISYKKKETLSGSDEVWIVFDSDANSDDTLCEVRNRASANNINLAQSNPCFEVWLYYHFFDTSPGEDAPITQIGWKEYLDKKVPGGVNVADCYDKVFAAINNSEANFSADENDIPTLFSTECHMLMRDIDKLLLLSKRSK